jgi:putative membrane protein
MNNLLRYTGILAASAAMLTLGACREKGDAGTTSGAIGTPAGDTAAVGMENDSVAGQDQSAEGGGLSDANIVALLDEANQADSAAGALAFGKATDPEVKAYAQLMMIEHHALRAQGQRVAKQLNLTPQPPQNDPVGPAAEQEMEVLRSTPKGPQFDRAYIDQEIAIHKAVIDLAGQAQAAAQNDELKQLIEQASLFLQKHLERAEEIQKKLGQPSA